MLVIKVKICPNFGFLGRIVQFVGKQIIALFISIIIMIAFL